ncbi:MAG: biotin/lipoyl-binding protein [Holdemanella sp.]|uniref:biotin/lipoyl-binding protein n=1 Tax=Holdemanella sp. TaxID=1971762 RepID=UPI002583778A|nr:biotin/lipoyl-binding protein [Holdemanella sp.]MCI7165927.1 biotin/lipoyl-binding protein [Holdemanella sp.]MDY5474951.1 biotin/lipoyl-binding protein [Holdemanella porci]
MKPSIKKGIIITSICAFTLVGIKFYLNSTNKIDVNSVSTLNTGYWDNPSTSTGFVSNSDTQSVLYDASKTITQVFVQEGQQVNAGDPLLSYDLTTLQSAVDTSQLDVEKAQNAITLAEHELKKLLNTTPIPDVVEEPEIQDHTPAPLPGVPAKDGNGFYPYVLSLSQAEKNFTAYKIYYASTTSEAPEKGPHEEASLWKEERETKESNNTCWYWIEYTYTDGSTNAYDPKDVVEYYSDKQQIPNKEIFLVGTKQNPYVFKLSENQGFVYGKLFLDNANLNQYLRFDVYTNDGEIDSSWLVRCDKFTTKQSMNEGDMYSVISHTKEEQKYVEVEQKPSQDISSGYTEIELAKAIRDKKQELKTLDLDLRKAKLSLSENKALLNDGIVRAKRSGIVRNIKDLSNPIQDGSAFLEVATGQGTYIKGSISELMLNQIKVGDTISAYCWTSGETFDAKIQSIDTVPSSNSNYNGSGNPNVSYYGFEAYAKDASKIQAGEYLELTFNLSSDTTSSIWLSKAYVKQEGNKYYVLKDVHGKLKKQYVTVGKIVWGDTMEIKDGLSDTDYIAFAYSKNAKEGVKTQKSSEATS